MLRQKTKDTKEIRMNESFTSLLGVEYPDDKMDEKSTAKTKKKITRTSEYINKLTTDIMTPNLMFPPNCRYAERFNEGTIIVIEEPPAIRTISVDISMGGYIATLEQQGKLEEYGYENFLRENKRPFMFSLAFPFMVFTFAINNNYELTEGRVSCKTKQLSGLSDMTFKVPLNNITGNDYVCWPEGFYTKKPSIYSAALWGIRSFWTSIFNSDYAYNVNEYKEKKCSGLTSYLEWQYMTQINPLFIYNAKWIRNGRLKETIDSLIERKNYTSLRSLTFKKLQNVFTTPSPSGKEIKPYARARKRKILFFDICQTTCLTGSSLVNVGDKFKYKKRKKQYGHIENFMGFIDGRGPTHVRIDVNGRLITMKLTGRFKSYISRRVNCYRKETKTTIGDTVVKRGDIITFKNLKGVNVYKKIEYIQRTINDQIEVKANEYYLAKNMKDVKVFDTENPVLYGMNLHKDEEYIIIPDTLQKSPIQFAYSAKYKKVGVTSNIIQFSFEDAISHQTYYIQPGKQFRRIYKEEELSDMKDEIFFTGRKIFGMYKSSVHKQVGWITPFGFLLNGNINTTRPSWESIKNLIKDDTFHIKSYNLELTFKIGDLVVVSDWSNPLNMLMIRKITGFKVDDKKQTISFTLEDKHGNLIDHLYVTYEQAIIHVGTIRKATTQVGRLSSGMKIMPKENDIPGFPEGSVNIIIAFITDTGGDEPLVLCSNCQTLWLDDVVTKFRKSSMKAKRWAKLKHSPFDINEIDFQCGDIVNGVYEYKSDYAYYLAEDPNQSDEGIQAFLLEHFDRYPDKYYVDKYVRNDLQFDCIINPRISTENMKQKGRIPGFMNFHGLITQVPSVLSEAHFLTENGRIINVQSVCE